ncbi:MAG: hypothetical protein SGPRY_010207 [Prymnesium sp.]
MATFCLSASLLLAALIGSSVEQAQRQAVLARHSYKTLKQLHPHPRRYHAIHQCRNIQCSHRAPTLEPVLTEPSGPPPSLQSPPAPLSSREQLLQTDALWGMLAADSGYLTQNDKAKVRYSLDILLRKTRPAGGPRRAEDVMSILAAVKMAQDILKLRCDAATVAAVLLGSSALTPSVPTWPLALPDAFTLEVDRLLHQQQALQAIRATVPDLDDANAYRARDALLQAVTDTNGRTDPRALFVLLATELTKLRNSASLPEATRQTLALEAVQLYAPLSHAIGCGDTFYELEALSYAKLFPESIRRLRRWYEEVWDDAHELVPRLVTELRDQLLSAPSLNGLFEDVSVTGRVKTPTSTFRKLLRDSIEDIADVRDILALRIIFTPADNVEAQLEELWGRPTSTSEADALLCHGIRCQLKRLWSEVPGRFKDFVTKPKANGYQSMHMNMLLSDGRCIEMQVRSARMHATAEYGVAAHHRYRATQLGGVAEGSERLQAALQSMLAPAREARALPFARTNSSSNLSTT